MEMIKIRQETSNDYETVFDVVKNAFEKAEHTDGDEHNLVGRLRKSESFIPELSLVAEIDGEIVAQIMFTKIKVADTVQVSLAPVSVLPSFQGKGLGAALIKEGHKIATALGYEFSILLGHPTYYPKFGYVPASSFGITAPFEVPDEAFMAINLKGEKSMLNGVVEYAKEFFEQ